MFLSLLFILLLVRLLELSVKCYESLIHHVHSINLILSSISLHGRAITYMMLQVLFLVNLLDSLRGVITL